MIIFLTETCSLFQIWYFLKRCSYQSIVRYKYNEMTLKTHVYFLCVIVSCAAWEWRKSKTPVHKKWTKLSTVSFVSGSWLEYTGRLFYVTTCATNSPRRSRVTSSASAPAAVPKCRQWTFSIKFTVFNLRLFSWPSLKKVSEMFHGRQTRVICKKHS
jgi:hypothetical protein